jgi:anti-sigma regulatory factor (Ser/Thr protein kinase)
MSHRLELLRDERAPAAARRAIDQLGAACDAATLTDARLLISELVTNSVQHGRGEKIVVHIDSDRPGLLRCEVIDDGRGFVPRGRGFVPRGRGGRLVGGWGLDLVEQIAGSWGVREGSTHVWFELATPGSARR